jgi:hypothetical protein
MTYVVQRNDTPASIAAKFGRPGQAAALVQVNPQKARQVVHGVTTFRSLNIGEVLNLPAGWGVGVHGTLGAAADVAADAAAILALSAADLCNGNGQTAITTFQQDYNATGTSTAITVTGLYDAPTQTALQATLNLTNSGTAPQACPPPNLAPTTPASGSSVTLAQLSTDLNAVIADSTICNGTPNSNVSTFQTDYNSYTNSTLTVDGKYGPATSQAAASVAQLSGATITGTPPASCSIYATSTPAAPSSGGTSTVTTTTSTSTTSSTSTASVTPWVIAGVAAVAGAGVFYFLKKHPATKGKHKPVHRQLAHHRR